MMAWEGVSQDRMQGWVVDLSIIRRQVAGGWTRALRRKPLNLRISVRSLLPALINVQPYGWAGLDWAGLRSSPSPPYRVPADGCCAINIWLTFRTARLKAAVQWHSNSGTRRRRQWDVMTLAPHERKQPTIGHNDGERRRCGNRGGDGEFFEFCARIRGPMQFWAKSHSFTEDKIPVRSSGLMPRKIAGMNPESEP